MLDQIEGRTGDLRWRRHDLTWHRRVRSVAGRELELAARRAAGVDPVLPVDLGEELPEACDALAAPEHEEAGPVQTVVEGGHHALLQRVPEIDEHVAAAHQIQAREGRVAGEIVPDEDAQLADQLVDPVPVVELDEVLVPDLLAQVVDGGVRKDAGARPLYRSLAHVRAEDLDGPRVLLVGGALEQRDGQRVDLFARRAPRHPSAQRCALGLALEDLGDDVLGQRLERRWLAEE